MEYRKDYIDAGLDLITNNFDRITGEDEFVLMKTGRKKGENRDAQSLQNQAGQSKGNLLQAVFWTLSVIIKNLNSFIAENFRNLEMAEETEHPFLYLLRHEYDRLRPEQKSVVNLLSFIHASGLVLPFLFVSGKITASEYAKGCLAMKITSGKNEKQKTAVESGFPYPVRELTDCHEDPGSCFMDYFRDAMIAGDFLFFHSETSATEPSVLQIIKKGESGDLEFKSTLRWDIRAGKTNPHVERASLKSICAFLNTAGGSLLIGVRDDGSVEGIESDRFVNEDKFLLHLWTLIRTSLGRDVSPYIRCRLEKSDEKTICVLKCSRSPRPVFLHQPGFDEEFFIRLGPSSTALDISEALKYIGDRFGKGMEDTGSRIQDTGSRIQDPGSHIPDPSYNTGLK
jgi:hypothetical protein